MVSHGRGRLVSGPEGMADYIEADLHRPGEILAAAARMLDLSAPVGLVLMGVMGHLDDEHAFAIVRELLAGLPAGSYLVLQDGARTSDSEAFTEAQEGYDDTGAIPYRLRTPAQIASFFDGLELVQPGVVPVSTWHPEPGQPAPELDSFGGIGRKAAS